MAFYLSVLLCGRLWHFDKKFKYIFLSWFQTFQQQQATGTYFIHSTVLNEMLYLWQAGASVQCKTAAPCAGWETYQQGDMAAAILSCQNFRLIFFKFQNHHSPAFTIVSFVKIEFAANCWLRVFTNVTSAPRTPSCLSSWAAESSRGRTGTRFWAPGGSSRNSSPSNTVLLPHNFCLDQTMSSIQIASFRQWLKVKHKNLHD